MDLRKLAVIGVALVLAAGALASGKTYVCYYDQSGGQDTEVTITNLGGSRASFTLRVFDHTGKLLYTDSDSLDPREAECYRMEEAIGHDDYRWGIIKLETGDDNFFALGVEYFSDGKLVSIDNIVEPLEEDRQDVQYWYSIYYVNVNRSSTGLILANPWWHESEVEVYIARQSGETLYRRHLTLKPASAYFLDLEEVVGQGGYQWGAVDILASSPILAACEYYDRRGSELEIDNVSQSYAIQPTH
jgi:hypothetical protein